MLSDTHNAFLVSISILIAICASYAALDLASRVRVAHSTTASFTWLFLASFAMGGGIWAMHFIAMLSFSMPGMVVSYDAGLTVLSFALAVSVTGVAFVVVNLLGRGWKALGLSGLMMGAGIVGMHYTGMAAMMVNATVAYDSKWVSISIFVAIVASIVALRLAFSRTGLLQKVVASLIMGLAISGMHFAGMQAAVYTTDLGMSAGHGHVGVGQNGLAVAIAAITFGILFLSLIASMVDRRLALLATAEADALRRSEEQFRSLYRRTPLPLHAFDELGRITEVSDTWLSLLGYQREDVVGRPFTEFMAASSAHRRVTTDWPKLLSAGELLGVEYQLVSKRGDLIDVLSSSRIERDGQGKFAAAIGGVVDITARKRTEEALRQSQKMETVGQLTGGVAHDFNNLLAVILGSLELLKKRYTLAPAAEQLLSNALEGAKRGASLTQRMLAFSRQQSLQPEPVDVTSLVRSMKDLLGRALGPQITIETKFPLSLSKALADSNQLENGVMNLVVNSRDAMPEGGTITISAREYVVTGNETHALKPGSYICLSVTDEGEGMTEAVLARAREPFFTTKGVSKGTGLGLSMVHGFAEQSGGALILNSKVGIGTTAEIWLPLTNDEPKALDVRLPDEQSQVVPYKPKLSVLAVDDDALVLMNTELMLRDLGHHVVTASSGAHALSLIEGGLAVDVVITDQAMPGMTGYQLAVTCRAKRPDLIILLATGYAEISDNEQLKLPLLSKPFTEAQLQQALTNCVSENRGRSIPSLAETTKTW